MTDELTGEQIDLLKRYMRVFNIACQEAEIPSSEVPDAILRMSQAVADSCELQKHNMSSAYAVHFNDLVRIAKGDTW